MYAFSMMADKGFRLHPGDKYIEGIEGVCFITEEKDILDLMGAGYQDDITRVLLHESNLDPDFFDLRTGLAGAIMQKLAMYGFKAVFIIQPDKLQGRFGEFVREANRGNQFRFVCNRSEAVGYL